MIRLLRKVPRDALQGPEVWRTPNKAGDAVPHGWTEPSPDGNLQLYRLRLSDQRLREIAETVEELIEELESGKLTCSTTFWRRLPEEVGNFLLEARDKFLAERR